MLSAPIKLVAPSLSARVCVLVCEYLSPQYFGNCHRGKMRKSHELSSDKKKTFKNAIFTHEPCFVII